LLSGSHAAVIVDRVLYVWNLPAGKLVYRIEDVAASEPPAFSGNQVYMAIPQGGKLTLVETATGTVRRSLATGNTLRPGAGFHPQGKLLALCFSNQYQVWDSEQGSIVSEATTTEHLGSHPVHWITPKMFRAPSGDVVHVDLGMSVWAYTSSASTDPAVVGDKMLTATTSQNCSVSSVVVPHAAALMSADQLLQAGDAAMLVRPGSTVSITVEGPDPADQTAIRASLAESAAKAGWKVADNAPITLVAKIGRGKTEQLNFRSLGSGSRTTSKASLTPFTADLEIRRDATVLWKRSTVNRIPPLLQLKEGETVQDAVRRYEKPDAAFFARLNLPPRILKPEITSQVGRSILKDGEWRDVNPSRAKPR
jgi:hypothetical protein